MQKVLAGSWKTTTCGILGFIVAVITFLAQPYLDTDPATVPNWTAFLAAAAAALGLVMARDNNKTSEQVNAGPK